jgi:hypothetical protein
MMDQLGHQVEIYYCYKSSSEWIRTHTAAVRTAGGRTGPSTIYSYVKIMMEHLGLQEQIL